MKRTLIALVLAITPLTAQAHSDANAMHQYADDESVASVAPMTWINDNGDAWRWVTEGCTTDSDCEAMVADLHDTSAK